MNCLKIRNQPGYVCWFRVRSDKFLPFFLQNLPIYVFQQTSFRVLVLEFLFRKIAGNSFSWEVVYVVKVFMKNEWIKLRFIQFSEQKLDFWEFNPSSFSHVYFRMQNREIIVCMCYSRKYIRKTFVLSFIPFAKFLLLML